MYALLVKHSLALSLMLKMVLDLTLRLTDSGVVNLSAHLSMYVCLILVHPQIEPNCYRAHELEKKRKCEQHAREVEHASFTLLVLGGMANQATVFYKRLVSYLEMGPTLQLNNVLAANQTHFLASAIQCIRGACSSCRHAARLPNPPLYLNSEHTRKYLQYPVIHKLPK